MEAKEDVIEIFGGESREKQLSIFLFFFSYLIFVWI